jgi:hypothetical protein
VVEEARVEFAILGPTAVRDHTGELGSRRGALLALLALHANRPVPTTGWCRTSGTANRPPVPSPTLHSHISNNAARLTRRLGLTLGQGLALERFAQKWAEQGPRDLLGVSGNVCSRGRKRPRLNSGGAVDFPATVLGRVSYVWLDRTMIEPLWGSVDACAT